MAIDTENKRRAALWVLPVPDGAVGALDRAQATEIYAGITIGLPAAGFCFPIHWHTDHFASSHFAQNHWYCSLAVPNVLPPFVMCGSAAFALPGLASGTARMEVVADDSAALELALQETVQMTDREC